MIHKFKHYLLDNSKQLKNIKLLKTNDLQDRVSIFLYTITTCIAFSFPTKHQPTYLTTLQTNISEAREYFLQKKANSSDKRYMKTRAKSWTALDMNTQQI